MKLQKKINNRNVAKSVFQANLEWDIEYHYKYLNYAQKIKQNYKYLILIKWLKQD